MSDIKRNFLHLFFYPESVAVVGASSNQKTLNFNLIANLVNLKYQGKIYPVNPNAEEILGIKAYPGIKDIPGSVDYVISCVPASEVLNLLEDCSHKGVKAIHLYTARFSETGRPDAAELEQEVLRQARKWNNGNGLAIRFRRQAHRNL